MAYDDDPAQPAHGTRLFLLRLWSETTTGPGEELCGKVQSVVTGEAHVFRGSHALVEALSRLLRDTRSVALRNGSSTETQTSSTDGQ